MNILIFLGVFQVITQELRDGQGYQVRDGDIIGVQYTTWLVRNNKRREQEKIGSCVYRSVRFRTISLQSRLTVTLESSRKLFWETTEESFKGGIQRCRYEQ